MSSILFEVANHIVKNIPNITAMKLQKLMYYCQSWSLAWDDKPLFNEDFQAWANGPVCKELYNVHRGEFSISENFFENMTDSKFEFSKEQLDTINAVLDFYGDKSPHYLSELTHKENPWKEARKSTPLGEPSKEIITKESMQNYYGGLIG